MTSRRNLFAVGRRRGAEDQLTELLVWLAEVVPNVRSSLLALAGLPHRAAEEVEVGTQHGIVAGRLDALVSGKGLALVVESKLASQYGQDQVRKYLEWLVRENAGSRDRGLMTLTAREAAWDPADVAYASEHGVVSAARRWEDLHEVLEPLAAAETTDPLPARLVREFLEMLSEEGLVPVKPLTDAELASAWPDAWSVIERYRDFFRACKGRIADATSASIVRGSGSDRGDWFWQDYEYADGVRLAVGVLNTDVFERLPPGSHRRSPIIWIGVKADAEPGWPTAAAWMDANPPQGWSGGNRWYERPTAWRYVAEVINSGTFEEQRDRLASAAAAARPWLADALAAAAAQGPGSTHGA